MSDLIGQPENTKKCTAKKVSKGCTQGAGGGGGGGGGRELQRRSAAEVYKVGRRV